VIKVYKVSEDIGVLRVKLEITEKEVHKEKEVIMVYLDWMVIEEMVVNMIIH
jgi:hypothetical protein